MYIDAIKGSSIALVIFIIAVWLIPAGGMVQGAEIILTVSSFLFAILAGFFISRLSERYNNIKQTISSEDATWLTLYKTSAIYGKKFQNDLSKLIEKYYIAAFEFVGVDYYKHTSKYFLAIYDLLYKYKKYKNEEIYSKLFDHMAVLERERNNTSVQSREKLTKGQWIIMILLAFIIVLSIFSLRTPNFYYNIITVLLSTILVLILLLIRDLENLRLGGKLLLVESGQEVFENMGKMRYYNQSLVGTGAVKVPPHVKEYRVGYHKPYEKPKIKIEKNPDYDKRYEKKHYELNYN